MLTPFDIFALVFGLLAGLSLAFLHAWLSRRAVEQLLGVSSGSTPEQAARSRPTARFALHGLIRVLLPALGLAALILISNGSLLAGLLGFLLGQRVALHHTPAQTVG